MNEKDILNSNFLLVEKVNASFGRRIIKCVDLKKTVDSNINNVYLANIQVGFNKFAKVKFVFKNETKECFMYFMDKETVAFKLIKCTNNIAEILKENDLIVYNNGDSFFKIRVIKIQKEYNRILVEELETKTRRNFSTFLKRYSNEDIVNVITYDQHLQKNKN